MFVASCTVLFYGRALQKKLQTVAHINPKACAAGVPLAGPLGCCARFACACRSGVGTPPAGARGGGSAQPLLAGHGCGNVCLSAHRHLLRLLRLGPRHLVRPPFFFSPHWARANNPALLRGACLCICRVPFVRALPARCAGRRRCCACCRCYMPCTRTPAGMSASRPTILQLC